MRVWWRYVSWRNRRRRAARWAAMTPTERWLHTELRAGLDAELDRQIVTGDGRSPGPAGILGDTDARG